MTANVAVHPTEGRRGAPLPTVGCNGWFGGMIATCQGRSLAAMAQDVSEDVDVDAIRADQ